MEFNPGVIEDGNFRFFINVEALTDPATNPLAPPLSAGNMKAARSMKRR